MNDKRPDDDEAVEAGRRGSVLSSEFAKFGAGDEEECDAALRRGADDQDVDGAGGYRLDLDLLGEPKPASVGGAGNGGGGMMAMMKKRRQDQDSDEGYDEGGSGSSSSSSSSSSSAASSLQKIPERESWSGKLDFLMSCIGFAVGLGNIWRFPYLCYKNGGGAFLIPYFICLVAGGLPVFFLEISLGQFMQTGPIGAWKICPIMGGIGYATTVITFLMNIYYIIILAWSLYFMFMSFSKQLPWAHCCNSWNTDKCSLGRMFCDVVGTNGSSLPVQSDGGLSGVEGSASQAAVGVLGAAARNASYVASDMVDPAIEFWEKKVLQISDGVDNMGSVIPELALCLFIVWVLVFFALFKGIKVTGKVVYFTATFPYLVLTILLIRGVTLPGAYDGLSFYLLQPNMTKLYNAQVWVDAGTQIFFSYAIALGAMIALGSYNNFYNNCYKDCVIVATINSCTSLYGGIAIFSILGFMAYEQGVPVAEVAERGPGLAFIAYPKAIAMMPSLPQLWSVAFFLMILTLGLGSQIVGVEAFLAAVIDRFPRQLRHRRAHITFAVAVVSFLVGLTMVTNGGMYVFQLFDYYSASGMSLLWVCFFESVTVAWLYGAGRFYDNLEMMLGFRINPWFGICWRYLTPAVTFGILIFSIVKFEPLTYNDYKYPTWALTIGQCMAFASMICIPGTAIGQILFTSGSPRERIIRLIRPILHNYQTPSKYRDRTTVVDLIDGAREVVRTNQFGLEAVP